MDDAYFLYHSIGQYPGKIADMSRAMAEFATRAAYNPTAEPPHSAQ